MVPICRTGKVILSCLVLSLSAVANLLLSLDMSLMCRMQSPTPFDGSFALNANIFSLDDARGFGAAMGARESVISEVMDLSLLLNIAIKKDVHEKYHMSLVDYQASNTSNAYQHPHAVYIQPIFQSVLSTDIDQEDVRSNDVVGYLLAVLPWDRFLINLLPSGVTGITCVLRNTCGQSYTYNLEGNSVCLPGHFIS
jgi:hypothetical protein